jgi:carboxyl-terminal processing protease
VSRYHHSSWHEEQPKPKNQPSFPGDADDFDHYPFLPETEDSSEQQHATGEMGREDPARRVRRILRQVLLTLALVVLAFFGGWFAHQFFNQKTFDLNNQSRAYAQLIQQAWSEIDQHYIDRNAVDYQKLSYAAINAMVNTLGDTGHSHFVDAQTLQVDQPVEGKVVSIGIYFRQDATTKQWIVNAPVPGSPADKAGVKPNDIVTTINGTDITGTDATLVARLIHGPVGTNVTLVIQRPGEDQPRTFKMSMVQLNGPNVIMHYIPESHIANIQVVQFTSGVAGDVRKAVNDAKGLGATKIILDLRNNPGGYVSEATDTSSLFLQSGNVLLEQDSTGHRTAIPASGKPLDTTTPIVILTNRATASAAEIVTAALQENHRVIVIGETTIGTGTILEQFPLADGSALYLGTQQWLTPNGHFVRRDPNDPNSGGVKPDIEVRQDPNTPILTANQENESNMSQQQILASGDAQLVAAIQYLNGQE